MKEEDVCSTIVRIEVREDYRGLGAEILASNNIEVCHQKCATKIFVYQGEIRRTLQVHKTATFDQDYGKPVLIGDKPYITLQEAMDWLQQGNEICKKIASQMKEEICSAKLLPVPFFKHNRYPFPVIQCSVLNKFLFDSDTSAYIGFIKGHYPDFMEGFYTPWEAELRIRKTATHKPSLQKYIGCFWPEMPSSFYQWIDVAKKGSNLTSTMAMYVHITPTYYYDAFVKDQLAEMTPMLPGSKTEFTPEWLEVNVYFPPVDKIVKMGSLLKDAYIGSEGEACVKFLVEHHSDPLFDPMADIESRVVSLPSPIYLPQALPSAARDPISPPSSDGEEAKTRVEPRFQEKTRTLTEPRLEEEPKELVKPCIEEPSTQAPTRRSNRIRALSKKRSSGKKKKEASNPAPTKKKKTGLLRVTGPVRPLSSSPSPPRLVVMDYPTRMWRAHVDKMAIKKENDANLLRRVSDAIVAGTPFDDLDEDLILAIKASYRDFILNN